MILHIDMDAFFAAVEQRDNPALKNKPVIVSGKSKRSVVSTASYEARKFGIRSAMPVFQAMQKCDHLIIIPANIKKYQADSKKIMEILSGFSPLVEPVSIDEAYVDITGCERLFGSPQEIACAIKKSIYTQLFLTSSVGIAPIKFLAKIASDMNKPDGLTIITKDQVKDFICTLPIQKVQGIGKSTMKQMDYLQIKNLGDIKKYDLDILTRKFGKMGPRLLALANGIDPSKVETDRTRKSISSEITLSKDIFDFEAVKHEILDRCQTVGKDLRQKKLVCENVFIKLKFSDFSQITRSRKLDTLICSSSAIFKEALDLYKKIRLKKKIRLIGVGVTGLKDKDTPVQMLLIKTQDRQKIQWESVDKAVDSISKKFGNHIVKKASLNQLCQSSHRRKNHMKNKIQVKVNIKGRVQGVYYRAETKNTADRFGVKGYVKNLSNGSVEAVFEGDQKIVTQMIEWCHQGPSAANVEHVQVEKTNNLSKFENFDIRY
ncbi:DNA polymerase IV [Desulfobacula toluolica]|uniref:DNA polymerase IV n=1 Tax=Desulfobacula toluolica (strain DSM 7467 / Tol2) TaxID=651182 RepID=K0NHG7_DESTT|nr:DNA polymerase IV [Desulfobacula toluolica]CCK80390.1 DinB: DNA-directed DNA polymerase IV [Desulfobacula toluolica Tol2]